MLEKKPCMKAEKVILTSGMYFSSACPENREASTHCMKRKYIGERSDGFDVVGSKVHFDRLKIHRNKRLLLLLVIKEGVYNA